MPFLSDKINIYHVDCKVFLPVLYYQYNEGIKKIRYLQRFQTIPLNIPLISNSHLLFLCLKEFCNFLKRMLRYQLVIEKNIIQYHQHQLITAWILFKRGHLNYLEMKFNIWFYFGYSGITYKLCTTELVLQCLHRSKQTESEHLGRKRNRWISKRDI